ncbi:hypothetical protein B9Z55_028164 [Caenorhabditis nigoni]|uniref:Uncharacterized protein n=1 Tax=Caenorhabditis nigoni TaxID=1611254 RepID=A0A2G5SCZ6_9PELO|nr:hypothetical protein B9Z55_028164 [Caenorhabditis nigoni]
MNSGNLPLILSEYFFIEPLGVPTSIAKEFEEGSPLLVKDLLKPETESTVSSSPMSSLASHVCLPQMRPSNLEVRIPNERQLPLALCENFFASSESNETRFIVVPDKLKVVSYEIPDGVFKTE